MGRPFFGFSAEGYFRPHNIFGVMPRDPFGIALHMAVTIIVALILLLWIASVSHAQGVAGTAPSLSPDATMILARLGLGRYAAGFASLVFVGGFVVAHVVPWLPVPMAAPVTFWAAFYARSYAVLNFIAGNYGKALNVSAPTKPAG
jgi:hypothetical protein